MLLLHNKIMKKVCGCGRSSAVALQDASFSDDPSNNFFVTAEEETASKSLTIVLSNRSKKFHFFYSQGEVKRLLMDLVFPHMTLCTLVTSWFCGNPSTKTLPLNFLV